MTETAGRRTPPAHVAKIASAGATGVFVLGLAAVMGYAEHSVADPAAPPTIAPAPIPTTLPAATTTSLAPPTTAILVPLATTIARGADARPGRRRSASRRDRHAAPTSTSRRHRVGAVAVSGPQAVRRFRAMGCRSTVIVEAGDVDVQRLAELAMIRIARLEAAWSTFLPDSDVSRLNRAAGAPVTVRPATVELLKAMVEATVVSAGAYDPTVPGHRPDETPWFEAVAIDPDGATVQADRRLCFDPGGIGKGLAADLVVADTMASGASAVAIFLGGDGRVSSDDGLRRWAIEVAAPDGTTSIDRLELDRGAVATSGCRRAHLVDPVTGRIVEPGEVVQVSVLAGTGATAEALTKAVLLGGDPHAVDRLDDQGIGVLALRADGRTTANATWGDHRALSAAGAVA